MKKIIKTLFVVVGFLATQSSLATEIVLESNVDGKVSTYYDNGNKMTDKQYSNGVPIGTWKAWHENGSESATVIFLDNTGQIEKVEAKYPSGALLYKGIASIRSQEEKDKGMVIYLGECSGRATMKGNGDKWYNKYELNFSSFYEDGSCEEAVKGNMRRAITQLYLKTTDKTTGNIYDFPWNQLWGTVPKFLREKESDSK